MPDGSSRRAPMTCQIGKRPEAAGFSHSRVPGWRTRAKPPPIPWLGPVHEICDIGCPRDDMMGEISEHPREFPRFEVNAYVDYTGNEVLLFHRIQNISLGGVCIQTTGVEEVGTLVDLVLNFPDLDASIAVTGEVVWANREPPMDMGIRYVDLDEERKDTLRKYINMVRK
jgi:uncharacterized protein (TIGR02266 family)